MDLVRVRFFKARDGALVYARTAYLEREEPSVRSLRQLEDVQEGDVAYVDDLYFRCMDPDPEDQVWRFVPPHDPSVHGLYHQAVVAESQGISRTCAGAA